jgi:hypothetical protein
MVNDRLQSAHSERGSNRHDEALGAHQRREGRPQGTEIPLHIQGHLDRSNFHKFCREVKPKARQAANHSFNHCC